jgi:hypothetical protein
MAADTIFFFLVDGTCKNNPEHVVERNKEINFQE